jgi:hypothetical protein
MTQKTLAYCKKNGGSKPPPYGKYRNSKKQFLILNSIIPQFSSLKRGAGEKAFFQESFSPAKNTTKNT